MKAVLCFYIWWILFLHVSSDSSADEINKLTEQIKQLEDKVKQLKFRLGEKDEELNKWKQDLEKEKEELENQKDQLVHKLRDVETKRKENKEEVQMMEKKITERKTSDEKDLLLEEKEKLLQSQWKLDEEKKFYERLILNIEKVMEPIEMHMMRIMQKNKDVKKTAEDDEDQTTSEKDQGRFLIWGRIVAATTGTVVGVLVFMILKYQISELQSDLKQLLQDNKQLCDTLNAVKHELQKDQLPPVNKQLDDTLKKVKTELETQKDQLVHKLQDVETKRKENKEEVQMVEKKITERKNSDDKELLLGDKEKLLKSQWKLDEQKKLYERQILNIEKVMEPIEMNMMRTMEENKDVKKPAEDDEGVNKPAEDDEDVKNDLSLTEQSSEKKQMLSHKLARLT